MRNQPFTGVLHYPSQLDRKPSRCQFAGSSRCERECTKRQQHVGDDDGDSESDLHLVRGAMNQQRLQVRSQSVSRQRGFTLIEILVALLVGLFLVGGLLAIVQRTRMTTSNQTALAQLQDNQRFAMALLSDVIQTAGYFPIPTYKLASVALVAAPPSFPTAGQAIDGTHTST